MWFSNVTVIVTVLKPDPVDTTKPLIVITSPKSGEKITGNVTISGTAEDDVGLIKVEFKFSGADEWSDVDGFEEWSIIINTTQLDDGKYALQFRAYDGTQYSDTGELLLNVDNSIGDETDGSDDEWFLRNIGPLPIIGYIGLITVIIIIGVSIGKRKPKDTGKRSSSTEAQFNPSAFSTPVPTPQIGVSQQPAQSNLQIQSSYSQQYPVQQPYPREGFQNTDNPSQSIPNVQQNHSSMPSHIPLGTPASSNLFPPQAHQYQQIPTGSWVCFKCNRNVNAEYQFCLNCGTKRSG